MFVESCFVESAAFKSALVEVVDARVAVEMLQFCAVFVLDVTTRLFQHVRLRGVHNGLCHKAIVNVEGRMVESLLVRRAEGTLKGRVDVESQFWLVGDDVVVVVNILQLIGRVVGDGWVSNGATCLGASVPVFVFVCVLVCICGFVSVGLCLFFCAFSFV